MSTDSHDAAMSTAEPARLKVAVLIVESFAYGTANSTIQLSTLLADNGWQVWLFYGDRVGTESAIKQVDDRIVLRRLPGNGLFKHATNIRYLIRAIPQDATVYHGHSSFGGAYARVIAVAARFKVPTLYSPRGYSFLRQDKSFISRALFWLLEWTLGRIGTTVACGPAEYQVARRVSSRATKINNGGLSIRFPEPPPEERVILGAGRICYQKGFDTFKDIAKLNPTVQFAWYGDVDPGAQHYINELPANLTVHASVNTQRLREIIQASRAVCLPSRWEGLSRFLLDAIAQGKPLIVSDIPSNVDCLKKLTGRTDKFEHENGFACRSLQDYTNAIQRLLESGELLERQSSASLSFFRQEFELEKVSASWTSLYQSLISR